MKSVMILLATLAAPALAVGNAQTPAPQAAPSQQAGRDAEAAFRAGFYKWQRQQPGDALADFDRALALTPNSSTVHAARALALADMRRFDEAETAAATAQRLRPSDAFAQGSAGYVQLLRGAFPAAVEAYTRANALEPSNPEWLDRRAEAYQGLGQMDLALADLDRVITLSPGNPAGYFQRARVLAHWSGDRQADALAAIDRAIAANPRASSYRIWRGDFLHRFGRRDEAAATYREALAALDRRIASTRGAPEDWMVETRLNLLGRSGRYAEAIEVADAEISRAPGRVSWLAARCWLRMEGGIALEAALSDCEEALRIEPNAPVASAARARLFLRMQRWQDAEHAFDDLVQRGTRSEANALYGRGIARIRLGSGAAGERDRRDARRRRFDVADDFIRFGLDVDPPAAVTATN